MTDPAPLPTPDDVTDGEIVRRAREDPEAFWTFFVDVYSPLVLRVIGRRLKDEDRRGDAYVQVLESLAEDGFRRLLAFRAPEGPDASVFPAWLTVFVRRRLVDHLRATGGRKRLPEAVEAMGDAERAFFRLHWWEGRGFSECWEVLRAKHGYAGAYEDVFALAAGIEDALSDNHRWRLVVGLAGRRPLVYDESPGEDDAVAFRAPPVGSPPGSVGESPERAADLAETRRLLREGLEGLPEPQAAALRGYHLEGKTVREIAEESGRSEKRVYKDMEAGARKLARYLTEKGLDREILLGSLESAT